jgi:hypothetical protein
MRRLEPLLALAQDGVATDEIGFLRAHGKAEAGLQHVILVGDVMAEMAERLFDAAAVQRVQAAELQAVVPPASVSVSNTCAAWSVET